MRVAFEAGGCAAQDDAGVATVGEFDGDVAGVVTRELVLFVAAVVFFVDDNQREIVDGCEDGTASADDDGGFTFADAFPLAVALRSGEA